VIVIGSNIYQGTITEEDIVIYPEVIIGNPLQAQMVVRYLLNIPGAVGGDGVYSKNDYLIAYNKDHAFLSEGKYLPIPIIESFFKKQNLKRYHDSYWIGKGTINDKINMSGTIQITRDYPKTRKELSIFLNETNIFYSFDELSVINCEAYFCGCQVFIIDKDGNKKEFDNAKYSQYDNWEKHFNNFMKDMEKIYEQQTTR
jgi:O-antigen biosynthesis protein